MIARAAPATALAAAAAIAISGRKALGFRPALLNMTGSSSK